MKLLGEVFPALPPGVAVFWGLCTLQVSRPEALAALVCSPKAAAEGAFALLKLSRERVQEDSSTALLTEEWLEVQHLWRRWVIAFGLDASLPLAVGVQDEQAALRSYWPGGHYEEELPPSTWNESWRLFLAEARRAEQTTRLMCDLLGEQGKITSDEWAFSLRLIEHLEVAGHQELAMQLASQLVDAYVREMSAPGEKDRPPDLTHCGPLLATLAHLLKSREEALWRRLLVPFDVESILEQVARTPGEPFSKGLFLIAHAAHLVALLPHASSDVWQDAAATFVDTYRKEKRKKLGISLFHWEARSSHQEESARLFVRLGAALTRGDVRSLPIIRSLLGITPSAVELAQMLWGLRDEGEHADIVRQALLSRVEEELDSPEGISLGEVSQIASALSRAREYDTLEKCAREILAITRRYPDMRPTGYVVAGYSHLKTALIGQGRFKDALEEHPSSGPFHPELQNLDVVALLELDQFTEAHHRLDQILSRWRADETAQVYRVIAFMKQQRWEEALKVAKGRPVLPKEPAARKEPAALKLAQLEAQCRWELHDPEGAARILQQLPREALSDPAVLRLRVDLLLLTSPDIEDLRRDVSALERSAHADTSKLRQLLASLTPREVTSGSFFEGLPRVQKRFKDRCRELHISDPSSHLRELISDALATLAQHPDLTAKLDEDGISRMVELLLRPALVPLGIEVKVRAPGGHGMKREGVTDLLLEEMGPAQHLRPLVRAEAKIWDGKSWLEEGLREIFGTANTGQEFFVALLVYCKEVNFLHCVSEARSTLKNFSGSPPEQGALFECIGEVDEDASSRGRAVKVLRSTHAVTADPSSARVTVCCFLVDLVTHASKRVREKPHKR